MAVSRNIAVQNLTPVVRDDEKAVQNPKRERWDGEEVNRCDGLAMVSEERQLADFRQERSVVGPFCGLMCKAILEQAKTELPSNCVTPASQWDPVFCK